MDASAAAGSTLTTLAAEAFLYYYPLVENLAQVNRYVTTGVGSNPAAPFNAFSHAQKLADASDTFVTINNDTVYSMASLDLSVGPLRLDVPATGDRYHVLQFVDAWTNNIAYIGTRATGNQAATYVIVPPGWTGELPDGTGIQATTMFERALVLSQAFPEVPEDVEYAAQFAPLGVGDAVSPYIDPAPALRDALVAGLPAGKAKMESISRHGKSPVVNGWTVGMHMFDYSQAFTDIDGQPLVGDQTYTMTFPQPPPVGAFWSITMYDIPNYYLVDNPIDRFSLGDRTHGIQYAGDGSLTLTISHTEPTDPVARANWLPAPDEKFRLVFRLYIPGQPIIDGTYQFPPIARQPPAAA